MGKLTKKRDTDIWNENAGIMANVRAEKADQFADNIDRNNEGISADKEKFILDDTTTPKVLPANRRHDRN